MISANFWKATMLCHSVRSCQLPSLSLKRSFVAMENLATGMPPCVNFTSGSLPRFPMRMTLFTLFIDQNSFEMLTIAELRWPLAVRHVRQNCDESAALRRNMEQHEIDDHARHRNIKPKWKRPARDGSNAGKLRSQYAG